jgi:hypothetical protein
MNLQLLSSHEDARCEFKNTLKLMHLPVHRHSCTQTHALTRTFQALMALLELSITALDGLLGTARL